MPYIKDQTTQKPVYIGPENHAELHKAQTEATEKGWENVMFENKVLDMGEVLNALWALDRERGGK